VPRGSLARALFLLRAGSKRGRGAVRRRFTPGPACERRNGGWRGVGRPSRLSSKFERFELKVE
jgi:hypothetical protein